MTSLLRGCVAEAHLMRDQTLQLRYSLVTSHQVACKSLSDVLPEQ